MRIRSLALAVTILLTGMTGTAEASKIRRCPKWESLAVQVGWKPGDVAKLSGIMYRESRCMPHVFNENKKSDGRVWSKDLGLMQINDYSWRRWLRNQGIIVQDADLFIPATNLRAALAIYQYGEDRHGNGWVAWSLTS